MPHELVRILSDKSTASVANAQTFSVVSTTEQDDTHLRHIKYVKYVVQNGSDPLNRFGVERVVRKVFANLTVPVILEPPLSSNAAIYTGGNAVGGADFENSVAAHLANAGLDVYLYSPREAFLVPGQCAAAGSCSEASGWGFSAFLSDLGFIRRT